jgi:hypothetical protein
MASASVLAIAKAFLHLALADEAQAIMPQLADFAAWKAANPSANLAAVALKVNAEEAAILSNSTGALNTLQTQAVTFFNGLGGAAVTSLTADATAAQATLNGIIAAVNAKPAAPAAAPVPAPAAT